MVRRPRVERAGLTALIFIALVAALFGLLGGSAAIGASTSRESSPAAYTYDSSPPPTADTHAHYDRGPPSARVDVHRHDAADLGSRGSSALADEGAPSVTYRYDYLAMSAKGAQRSASTAATTIGSTGDLSSVDRWQVAANTGRLTSRADELSGVLDPIARNSRTSAVLGTRQGRDVLAGGGRDLSPAQRALAGDGDVIARGPGLHAEVTAVNGARGAGLTPQGIGVSRPICPACISFLEDAGATITGPNSAWWY